MDDLLKVLLDRDTKPEKDVEIEGLGTVRVRALDDSDIKRISERSTFGKKVDEEKQSLLLIKEGTPYIDWSNPELLAKFQTDDPLTVIKKALLPGEKVKLVNEIMGISGFDLADLIAKAKNS
jgi:Phage XkdN-like tail assembly chaperone protein, TAC